MNKLITKLRATWSALLIVYRPRMRSFMAQKLIRSGIWLTEFGISIEDGER